MAFKTPILMIVFNRPDVTRKVFEKVREQKPMHLFIAADGPRQTNSTDNLKCAEVKKIFDDIDWECEVKTLYRDNNMGCHKAVPDAISWFFDNVEQGIILEDDCYPDASFFPFCEELLNKYKNNPNIMMISGDNFIPDIKTDSSYFFSKYAFIWGWATWKRSWVKFDDKMITYPKFKSNNKMPFVFKNIIERFFWLTAFNNKYSGKKEGWDTKWIYALVVNQGLSIIPGTNLIQNLGFTPEATTTTGSGVETYSIAHKPIEFPLQHPKEIHINYKYDNRAFKKVFLSTVSVKMVIKNYFPAHRKA